MIVVLVVGKAPPKDDGCDVLSPKGASVGGPRYLVSGNVRRTGSKDVGEAVSRVCRRRANSVPYGGWELVLLCALIEVFVLASPQ